MLLQSDSHFVSALICKLISPWNKIVLQPEILSLKIFYLYEKFE